MARDAGNNDILVLAPDSAESFGGTDDKSHSEHLDQIQRFEDYTVEYFKEPTSSFGFLIVAYDVSLNFGFVDHSAFYYNQKYVQIFDMHTNY